MQESSKTEISNIIARCLLDEGGRTLMKIWGQSEYPREVIEILRQYVDGQISVKDGEKMLTDHRKEERKTRMQTPQEFAEEFLQRDRSCGRCALSI